MSGSSMIDNIFTKGFVQFAEPEALDLINLDSFELLNREDRLRDNGRADLHPDLVDRLDMFSQHLMSKYIEPKWNDAEFMYWIVWEGVDNDNTGWHTDFMEQYDVFFLYYFDYTDPSTGGSISFKWNETEIYTHHPKAGDLILINNRRGFWHKAEHTPLQRRVASFNFKIND